MQLRCLLFLTMSWWAVGRITTTDHRAGMFESKFFDKVLEKEIGVVRGHFAPINALAFNPDGKSFSSGSEDGFVRLNHFDPDYFEIMA